MFGDCVSANIVGYGPTETIEGGVVAGASFVPVSGDTVDLSEITVTGYKKELGSASEVYVMSMDELGQTVGLNYTWIDVNFGGTQFTGWFVDSDVDSPYEDQDEEDQIKLLPGQGIWVSSENDTLSLQSSGEVAVNGVDTPLIEGGMALINPQPVIVSLANCDVVGYDKKLGSMSEVYVMSMDELGQTVGLNYTWIDVNFGGTQFTGWFVDSDVDQPIEDQAEEDQIFMKPGQGIWASSENDTLSFAWPEIDLGK